MILLAINDFTNDVNDLEKIINIRVKRFGVSMCIVNDLFLEVRQSYKFIARMEKVIQNLLRRYVYRFCGCICFNR